MKLIVIGAVASGTTAATKARRNNEDIEITIYEKDTDISYSGCGLTHYLGGEVTSMDELVPRDVAYFKDHHNIDIHIAHEVLSVDRKEKKVIVKNLRTQETFEDHYDKLLIATGASPFVPPIEGRELKHVFTIRNPQSALNIEEYITQFKPQTAVVAGSGSIGMEMVEALTTRGIDCTLVELEPFLAPNLDEDMSKLLSSHLSEKNIKVVTGAGVKTITQGKVELTSGEQLNADMVILATGVRPNTAFIKDIGLDFGKSRALLVDEKMATNDPDIYAAGDCIEVKHTISKKNVYRPMGSTANKTGRVAGDAITGGTLTFDGVLGTGIYRLMDLTIGSSGLTEKEAQESGYSVEVIHMTKPNQPEYLGGQPMVIKAIANREDGRIIGVQIIGYEGVDKRLDVFVAIMSLKGTVHDLVHLDLAYAPAFSTSKDPIHYVGMVLEKSFGQDRKIITYDQMTKLENIQLVDARVLNDLKERGSLPDHIHMPHLEARLRLDELDPKKITVVYCNTGSTSNAVMNILKNKGFKKVFNLSGGNTMYQRINKK